MPAYVVGPGEFWRTCAVRPLTTLTLLGHILQLSSSRVASSMSTSASRNEFATWQLLPHPQEPPEPPMVVTPGITFDPVPSLPVLFLGWTLTRPRNFCKTGLRSGRQAQMTAHSPSITVKTHGTQISTAWGGQYIKEAMCRDRAVGNSNLLATSASGPARYNRIRNIIRIPLTRETLKRSKLASATNLLG